ncbi:MAG TPA: ribosomal protein S18-alanine N-acetyltransferase [Gemmatimonadales bacterium]
MDDDCLIRPAIGADLDDVAAIEQEVFPDPWSRALLAEHLRDVFLVAVVRDAVVGFLIARAADDEAEVLNLAVRPDVRRRHAGTRLLETALGVLLGAGVRQVFLEVRPSNSAARLFYEGMGFTPVGRRRAYYRLPTEDALVLARPLPG